MTRLNRAMREFLDNVYGDDLGEPDFDDRPVYVLDNGASEQISDLPAIYPGEIPRSAEDVELERDSTVGRSDEQVLGAQMGERVRGVVRTPFRDDFVDSLRQMALAGTGPNGEQLDEFDQRFQMQRATHAQLVETAPFARTQPPSALNGLLGGTVLVAPGQTVVAARWDSDHDSETCPITITLAGIADLFSGGAISAAFRPFARVLFGTRGNLTQIDVDIGRGKQFTVTASSVVLMLGVEDNVALSSAPLALTGMISYGQCVRTSPISRTLYISLGNGATSAIGVVPMFASRVSIYRNDAQQAVTLNFFNASGGQPRLSFLRAAAGQSAEQSVMDPLPLAGELSLFTVVNGGGSAVLVELVFELSL